ncbi:glycerol-3-phosphate dehydrogenase [Enterovibrio nigricans]|uniref:Glycerol-3-phosphate dehydrogenase n=1 Tax=Enterovibrio nigricans DSM 22720 TaxID=1121868 RepID=A0A1T4UCM6_9GAMM|nr:glycerol-3-phosphate dehydrogenase [Enterovibrio nigricans]PKF50984.1 glycerol-3-phosphate dehydrogenase [Enterovibrio nigricans]SKA50419.1 glycerol-3-phosphate dehydrogenase [Enterovibrio nigricans DSM 22720]
MKDEHNCTVDLFVIGGGINGVGIARDAAGRGLDVILCEKEDLAEGTSSRSGKLIHGGLRYLEYFEFRLVSEALKERDVLLRSAPHIIWPLRFVLLLGEGKRPSWFIRLGLFLYDHIGGNQTLPNTTTRKLSPLKEGLKRQFKTAYEYSDCWVDDSRLVILSAMDAYEKGAKILPRTRCDEVTRSAGGYWRVVTTDQQGRQTIFRSRAVVNAAGPWINDVNERVLKFASKRRVRLVKGSHLVAKKFWQGDHAYLLQNPDKRVIFVNPYLDDLCLIGTTDVSYAGNPEDVAIDAHETKYLLETLSRYFDDPPCESDILHAFSGVRPLFDDDSNNPSAVTRDYELELDSVSGMTPLLNIYGGKITTFRELSQHAMEKLKPFFPAMKPNWTVNATLPGGDMGRDVGVFIKKVEKAYPWLPCSLVHHYVRLYGTRLFVLLEGAQATADLGEHFGGLLYAREAEYLIRHEWALTSEDILERRTKHGLFLTNEQKQKFAQWVLVKQPSLPASNDSAMSC